MSDSSYFIDVLVLLAAAVMMVPVFLRLGFGSILGYLAAGVAVGPWGFALIKDIEEIRRLSEFGVVFLLFAIGIRLRPKQLWAMRQTVFGLGTAQVTLTGAALSAITWMFGIPLNASIVIGFGLALSSTAIGMQVLAEGGELRTVAGHNAFSILLLQDLAVVPLLIMVSLLAPNDLALTESVPLAVLEALLAIAGVILFSRFILTPILRQVASGRSAEIFAGTVLLTILTIAWVMEEVGFSMAMGAFLAGLMLAESNYRHQIIADIQPFRGFLLGLFFMTVGMTVDLDLLSARVGLIVALLAGLLLIKAAIIWVLCQFSKVRGPLARRVALLLAQSGEFGFVLFALATDSGIIDRDLHTMLTLIVAASMLATPFLLKLGSTIESMVRTSTENGNPAEAPNTENALIVIAGFGRMGRRIATILRTCEIPYVALDSDPARIDATRKEGYEVLYGDATHVDVLKSVGVNRAPILVVTLNHPELAFQAVVNMRRLSPDSPIYVRAHDRESEEKLRSAGANFTVSENLEASLQLAEGILETAGISAEQGRQTITDFRLKYYEALGETPQEEEI